MQQIALNIIWVSLARGVMPDGLATEQFERSEVFGLQLSGWCGMTFFLEMQPSHPVVVTFLSVLDGPPS